MDLKNICASPPPIRTKCKSTKDSTKSKSCSDDGKPLKSSSTSSTSSPITFKVPLLDIDKITETDIEEEVPLYLISELQTRINKEEITGKGAYGRVYKCTDDDENILALKRNIIDDDVSFIGSVREMDLMARCKGHPYIIDLKSISFGAPFQGGMTSPIANSKKDLDNRRDDTIHFVFEHAICDGIALMNIRRLTYIHIKIAALQICLGLEYLHSQNIIHRDLKPGNILYFQSNNEMNMRICDLGLSKIFSKQEPQSPGAVTPWYRAPEIICECSSYDQASDVWSLGCILFEFLTKKPLLYGSEITDEKMAWVIFGKFCINPNIRSKSSFFKQFDRNPQFYLNNSPTTTSERIKTLINLTPNAIESFNSSEIQGYKNYGNYDDFCELIAGMLQVNPKERMTMEEVIESPFFKPWNWLIKGVREKYPPKLSDLTQTYEQIRIIYIPEMVWGKDLVCTLFNFQDKRSIKKWYSHRTIFQAFDLYSRYFLWHIKNRKAYPENVGKYNGLYVSQKEAACIFCACLYISIKYYHSMRSAPSYNEIFSSFMLEKSYIYRVGKYEKIILSKVCKYKIYRETIIEYADRLSHEYKDVEIRDLLFLMTNPGHLQRISNNYSEFQTPFENVSLPQNLTMYTCSIPKLYDFYWENQEAVKRIVNFTKS